MMSILQEIKQLRGDRPLTIDYDNVNRYRVVFQENDNSKTAYYFSVPVYNIHTRKIVDIKFHNQDSQMCVLGSNCTVTISDNIRLENTRSYCSLPLNHSVQYISEYELKCGDDKLLPTTNGVVYQARVKHDADFSIDLVTPDPTMDVRANDKYFSLMREKFQPFITVSSIGTANANREIISPAKIKYQKLSNEQYRLTITPCDPHATYLLFEVNLYEPKLFQDTTVESYNSTLNNAFGTTAFIGNTSQFGEQWLYSRPDFTKMPELTGKQINRAILYLPHYHALGTELSAFKVSSRFCSFGSNWKNKIAASHFVADSVNADNYQHIDLTTLVTGANSNRFKTSDGFILRTKVKGSGFSVIPTGDSHYAPQIFEVNFS